MRATRFVTVVAALAWSASPIMAQTYSIPRHVIAGGGGTSTAGPFSLSGTIVEIGAGGAMTSGPYSMTGGFWSFPIAAPFTDSPLLSGVTTVRALHITELRGRVNTQRARFGLAAASWTNPSLVAGVVVITAQHVSELRTAILQTYQQAGLPPPVFDDGLVPGITAVKALHLSQLRAALAILEES